MAQAKVLTQSELDQECVLEKLLNLKWAML